jgi:hypothetical protein
MIENEQIRMFEDNNESFSAIVSVPRENIPATASAISIAPRPPSAGDPVQSRCNV